ncbi:Sir2 silent information regulator family NAD-dependent deacetylase [Lactobacillus sp.]|uniref:Sir2 silent information regulator family NAD-dependent deacetylase n=1 Tax=Lactobacillus sp. TaxID=1591 RepID=UPI0025B7EE67|nr:Sir2 silent information regulator family NAD-dependent deacetylase [Lactobacillus sp.]
MNNFMKSYSTSIEKAKRELHTTNNIVIGAGSGLSTAAGMTYSGPRFEKYFSDFENSFGITDMYTGGFYNFTDPTVRWAYWSRMIWINRYMPAPHKTYEELYSLIKDKNYFVITTNVDHQFQKAGFNKNRLFYTQGDYGLFQKLYGEQKTYDNYELIRKMILSQGFEIGKDNQLIIPKEGVSMHISAELADKVKIYTKNLREDDTFVEDEGWHQASQRYTDFINKHLNDKIIYLELGVGMNTPGIIKYPFWNLTAANPKAKFITIDAQNIIYPEQISDQAIGIKGNINDVLKKLAK